MDYLISNPLNSAEVVSLAQILKELDEREVRKNLDQLVNHGILTKRTRPLDLFEKKYSKEMGIDMTKIKYSPSQKRVELYSFNKDLIFILKTRIHLLTNQALGSSDQKSKTLHNYACSNERCPNSAKKLNDRLIQEIDAKKYDFKCQICGFKLIRVASETDLDETESKALETVLNELEEDLKKFDNYRIPSKFFGLGAQTVDYFYGSSNLTENLDDVEFIIKLQSLDQYLCPVQKQVKKEVLLDFAQILLQQTTKDKLKQLKEEEKKMFEFYEDLSIQPQTKRRKAT